MEGGERRDPQGHGFKHCVGNTFLPPVFVSDRGVEEKVAVGEDSFDAIPVEEVTKIDSISESERGDACGDARSFRSVTGQGEACFGELGTNLREGTEGGFQSLFRHKTTDLSKPPGAVFRGGGGSMLSSP